jgi:hypothetical protein
MSYGGAFGVISAISNTERGLLRLSMRTTSPGVSVGIRDPERLVFIDETG